MKALQKPIRIATVGTSKIMRIIQDAMRRVDGMNCSVIYSRDLARADAFAREMEAAGTPQPAICDDLAALPLREDVDIVYLASPNRLHFEQAMQVMRAGKSVIIEKPVAVLAEKVEQLHETALANDVVFLEAISTLFMPNYLWLKSDVLPRLGKIRKARMSYGRYSSMYDAYKRGENPNVFSPAMEGGALNDMGVYCVHMAVDLFGEPRDVSMRTQRGPDGADLTVDLTLRYPDYYGPGEDLAIDLKASKSENIPCGCWLEGENGRYDFACEAHDFEGEACAVIGGEKIVCDLQDGVNRMVYEQAAMRDCLADADTAFFERMYRQTLSVVRVLEKAHAAAVPV